MWAAYNGKSDEVLTVLKIIGADLDMVDSTGFTALHWAVRAFFY
jgi:ankyrin repeat protein